MKRKKLLVLTMSVMLTAASFSACAKESSQKKEVTNAPTNTSKTDTSKTDEIETTNQITFPLKEKAQFTAFTVSNSGHVLDDSLAMQTAMEKTNVSIKFDSVLRSDLTEKRNLLLNSGEYPDMFFRAGLSMDDLDKYGPEGIFIPLEDLIHKYAPNLTALMDEKDLWQYITNSDGHVYSLPYFEKPYGKIKAYWLNKKWLDNLNLSVPTSFDELYNVLKAFKEQDANGNGDPNDEIPFMTNDIYPPEYLLAYADYCYDQDTKCAVIDGKLTYIPVDSRFKDYISFITKLYEEGIMDKNGFTQKYEQQAAIGQTKDILGSFFDAGAFLTVGRDNDDDYIYLPPFSKGCFPLRPEIYAGTLAITDVCKNPEILIAWADQFYTEEGGILAWLGVEGKTYKVNSDGTWEWLLNNGYGDDIGTLRMINTIQGPAFHPSIQPDFWFDKMSKDVDPDEVYLNEQRAITAKDGKVALPILSYTQEQKQRMATLKTDIDAYILEYTAQVSTGKLNLEESWNKYIDTLKAMGVDELIDIYTKAYEQAVAK